MSQIDPEFERAVVEDLKNLRAYTRETRRALWPVVVWAGCVSSLVSLATTLLFHWTRVAGR